MLEIIPILKVESRPIVTKYRAVDSFLNPGVLAVIEYRLSISLSGFFF